ncbi:uncharacterized protein [Arachis hypogaea]|uniref:uncharacterized protein n=1 Tax=Arachis hypogaea TaxID=3818 RepID=UPI003B20F619
MIGQVHLCDFSSETKSNTIEAQIVYELKEMLDLHNHLAKNICFARDRFVEGSNPEIKLRLIRKRKKDGRVYNLPTVTEVAILIVGDIDDSILKRDIIIESTSNRLQRINALHPYAGYPSYFITITCNPEWGEIKRLLKDIGLKEEDKLDIVSRIFNIKLSELIADFKQGRFFRKITGYVCTMEFQKRGLPYAHILLFMHPLYKPKSPKDIDKLISAEIPDKRKRLKLYAAIEKFMSHSFFFQSNDEGQLEKVIDEIRNYYDCRYIFACEATWRIFGYEIQLKQPSVVRLPFHLPNKNPVVFRDYENIVDLIDRVDGKPTKILAWMLANKLFAFGRVLTYSQFPNKFVWKEDISMWMPRKQGFSIGRLTHVPRGNGEDYYLRLLLNIQKGCLSFVDLRTVEAMVYTTFKEACYALGLLPEIVWQQCYGVLSEDILYNHRKNCILQANGRSLKEFDQMPFPSITSVDGLDDRLIMDELNFDRGVLHNEFTKNFTEMNVDQRKAFEVIMKAVDANDGGFSFLFMVMEVLERHSTTLKDVDEFATWLLGIGDGLVGDSTDGILVMLLHNIDQSNGLCNGTRLQVRRLGNHVIECITLTGDKVGQVVLIPRMIMIPNNQALPFRFQRRQFPIIVSFAMTI